MSPRRQNDGLLALLAGLGLGAWVMYLYDPEYGPDRRRRLSRQLKSTLNTSARMLNERAQGFSSDDQKDLIDTVLTSLVRAEIERFTGEPGMVEISARKGRVTLSGEVGSSQIEPLVARAYEVPGVSSVDNRLKIRQNVN